MDSGKQPLLEQLRNINWCRKLKTRIRKVGKDVQCERKWRASKARRESGLKYRGGQRDKIDGRDGRKSTIVALYNKKMTGRTPRDETELKGRKRPCERL